MKKKTIVTALLITMIVSMFTVIPAQAAEPDEPYITISPCYVNIASIAPGLSVSGTTATYALSVVGATDVTIITAVLQIQKKNSDGTYSNYGDSWTASASDYYLNTSGTKTVASGATYRLKATVTAKNSTTATEIAYS